LFQFGSIQQYHLDLNDGTTSCEEAVRHYLKKINEHSALNAFTGVYEAEAIEQAVALDRKRKSGATTGPLHGVVIALKDVICYKDHPVTAASSILKGFRSVYSATAVQRLLDAEAIIIGHTNCDEFAMGSTNENSSYGPVLNSIDTGRVPGGSSGGSAVAVQAGLCMVSLGSDTGGSVRQPADFCGIIGLKPTYGKISRYGLIAYASSFDQIGIFGTSIDDVRVTLEVMAGPDGFDSTAVAAPAITNATSTPRRIAYFRQALENSSLDPEIRSSFFELISKLKTDGYEVEAIDFDLFDFIVPTYYILTTAEASSNLSRFDGIRYGARRDYREKSENSFYFSNRSSGFGKEVKRRIMLGTFVLSAGYYDAYFTKAQQVRKLLVDQTRLIFTQYDAILLPNSPTTAFPLGEKLTDPVSMYLADIFTVFANLTGIPGISLPLFWHSNGMPYGVQIMTNHFCEVSLLHLSERWMQQFKTFGNEKPQPSTPKVAF
jgi:aspartyl-tRNA(Asn)/glutamyl-tRNA(Gln) amidotransferase subunit A